uniref:Uncharacterized protein n=1 Tax=Aegilops tauschii subsp. strangulata TaxID=200361 RepID=A0A453L6L9_AEGTS
GGVPSRQSGFPRCLVSLGCPSAAGADAIDPPSASPSFLDPNSDKARPAASKLKIIDRAADREREKERESLRLICALEPGVVAPYHGAAGTQSAHVCAARSASPANSRPQWTGNFIPG